MIEKLIEVINIIRKPKPIFASWNFDYQQKCCQGPNADCP